MMSRSASPARSRIVTAETTVGARAAGPDPPRRRGPDRPDPPRVSSTADGPPERATRVEGSIATADPGPDRAAPRLPRGIGATVRAALASFAPRWVRVGLAVLGAPRYLLP